MIGMNIVTDASTLARATFNALLFCPKEEPWAICYIHVTEGCVSYLTSDGYALAWATHEAETFGLRADEVTFKISRDDLANLEKRSREGKNERVQLEFSMDDREIWYLGEESEKNFCMSDTFEDGPGNSWDEINLLSFREIISEREVDPLARKVLLKPEYLQKVGRTKRDKNTAADIWISLESDTVLIKVGDGTRLAIEPIDHERHKKALGEGATW